jgi:hypothetical protein
MSLRYELVGYDKFIKFIKFILVSTSYNGGDLGGLCGMAVRDNPKNFRATYTHPSNRNSGACRGPRFTTFTKPYVS